jgi:hypothetical protein
MAPAGGAGGLEGADTMSSTGSQAPSLPS